MLATWGRVLTHSAGLNAIKPLSIYKTVVPISQFLPITSRPLATATATKKAGTTAQKKTATTTTTRGRKAPAKSITTSATKKAPVKTTARSTKASRATASKATDTTVKRAKAPKKTEGEKQREHVKSLLERALDPPSIHRPTSSWLAFLKDKFSSTKGSGGITGVQLLTKNSAQWVAEYKSLTPAQLEKLKARSDAEKDASREALAKWIKSHTPAEIHQANLARIQIRKLKKEDPVPYGLRGKSYPAIPDDRYPLRARTAQVFYVMDHLSQVPKEKKMAAVAEAMKNYASLSEAEQKKYRDLAVQDKNRFHNELRTVGIQPPI